MEATYKNWTIELNGATRNWAENQMWYGATNDEIKIVHVNNGSKLCSIEVPAKLPILEVKKLFLEYFGISVKGETIRYRG